MPLHPKLLHSKLNAPKDTTVSLDSLLGLLSSAYGTEELDCKDVFKEGAVNWRSLSVDNFQLGAKQKSVEVKKQPKLKNSGSEHKKINAATSTTNLKVDKFGSELDLTLVCIKSLENLKLTVPCQNTVEADDLDKKCCDVNEDSKQITPEVESATSEMEDPKSFDDTQITQEEARPMICGFYVDNSNRKLLFNIKFMKKIVEKNIFPNFDIGNQEICIKVKDEIKQSILCIDVQKDHLVSKSHYFAKVEKEFGLANLDVLVESNSNVFHWIVQWVKSDIAMYKPSLNVNILAIVLSLSYHLGISQLVEECLSFLYDNLITVLETDCDIDSIFDDDLLVVFVKRLSNSEITNIKDDFVNFRESMFCTLIKLLVDPNPLMDIGHYSTLGTIFQCASCEKLLNSEMVNLVPCKGENNKLNLSGELEYLHKCLPTWSLSRYVELLHDNVQSWQQVYWQLWGTCHFLHCSKCKTPYPLSQSDWCPFHPSSVVYFPMNGDTTHPIGMYTCCGEKAFRFNLIEPHSGCRYISHTPDLSSEDSKQIFQIYEAHRDLISCKPPEEVMVKKFVKLVKKVADDESCLDETPSEHFWWEGLQLVPKDIKNTNSIIPKEVLNYFKGKTVANKIELMLKTLTYKPQVHFGTIPFNAPAIIDSLTTETCPARRKKSKPKVTLERAKSSNPFSLSSVRNKTKKRKFSSAVLYQPSAGSSWTASESNKDNQDNQRDFEEITMRKLVTMLSTGPTGFTAEPLPGTYLRLESDWWQEHGGAYGKASGSSTVVNRTFPLSWFRRLTI